MIQNPNNLNTQITNLIGGAYIFQVEVIDNDPGGPGGAFKEVGALVSFTLDSVVFVTGSGTILGLPGNVAISVTL